MSDALVLHDVAKSNLPASQKSAIRRWYDGITGGVHTIDGIGGHVREGGHVIREGGEALITGLALGLIHAERGSLDIGEVPIDGIVALLGYGSSIYMAHDPYGICADMRHIGSDALAILSYRKSKEWREKGKAMTAHGETLGEDPIALAARDL